MQLVDFLRQTREDVLQNSSESDSVFEELSFTEVVMQHMSDIGMTSDFQVCHFNRKIGGKNLRLSGFAITEELDQLDLFVSLYTGTNEILPITDTETKQAAQQCLMFLGDCATGKLGKKIEVSDDAYSLADTIKNIYAGLDQIRIYVLTDRQAKTKNFQDRELAGKTVKLEVMDIERLYRHWSEGKPRDELIVNFNEVSGGPLPCVSVSGVSAEYDYILAALPGEALRFIYEKYGSRLLEANVRSFLSVTGKVNKGIRDTLKHEPEHFMAFNNGIVVIADEAGLCTTSESGAGLAWLKGMQIVNGGQTTASLYFTKKKNPEVDLSLVRVAAKIIVMKSMTVETEEDLISDISKYANSQNSVRQSDLSANKPFHIELEKLSMSVYCPDGVSRWFYERAAGSYNTMLSRMGGTPAQLRQIKRAIPYSHKITKTDLSKYIHSWDQKPYLASLGGEKSFAGLMGQAETDQQLKFDVQEYKMLISKAILFTKTREIARPLFSGSGTLNYIVIYLVSLLSNRFGDKINLDMIWNKQDISSELRQLIRAWASEVSQKLNASANGRLVSEWAKKTECWDIVKNANYTEPSRDIPDLPL